MPTAKSTEATAIKLVCFKSDLSSVCFDLCFQPKSQCGASAWQTRSTQFWPAAQPNKIFRRKSEMAEPQTFAATTVNGKTEAILVVSETKKMAAWQWHFKVNLPNVQGILVRYWLLRHISLVVISIILDQISGFGILCLAVTISDPLTKASQVLSQKHVKVFHLSYLPVFPVFHHISKSQVSIFLVFIKPSAHSVFGFRSWKRTKPWKHSASE